MTKFSVAERLNYQEQYFDWLCGVVASQYDLRHCQFGKLLRKLHDTVYIPFSQSDENRATDGVTLRYIYVADYLKKPEVEDALNGQCSMLEMMVALARKAEDIMYEPDIGDRTGQWFWFMVNNLGLGGMFDKRFSNEYADNILKRFMANKYSQNGDGGLFKIRNYDSDLTKQDIWTQMCWYLNQFE